MYPLLKPIANNAIFAVLQKRRGVRVVEGARLESVYMGNCIMSSNLIVSANFYLFLFAMFYSYILLSEKDGKYYYGSTNNLQNRLLKHNKGDVKSTKHRRPLKIHFFEEFNTRSEAFQREHFYKSIVGYNWLKQNNII